MYSELIYIFIRFKNLTIYLFLNIFQIDGKYK